MGNYRFRLSDMMPNAWFYKLRDMSRTRKNTAAAAASTTTTTSHSVKKKQLPASTKSKKPNLSGPRNSNFQNPEPRKSNRFHSSPRNSKSGDAKFPDPPRKSSDRRTKRKTIYKPSPRLVSSSVSVSSTDSSPEPDLFKSLLSDSELENTFETLSASRRSSSSCRFSSSATEFIIEMHEKPISGKIENSDGFDSISEPELPPILTRLSKSEEITKPYYESILHRIDDAPEDAVKAGRVGRRSVSRSPGKKVKLRAKSPKLGRNWSHSHGRRSPSKSKRKSLSESLAVVKSSIDPERDFRESMVEMIMENNIRGSKGLEELLACYLSLNSNEYHDLIIRAFEQIWFTMPDLRL